MGAHAAPSCGQTVSGEVISGTSFSISDLDENHTCGGSSLRLDVPVSNSNYVLNFRLSNMGTSQKGFDAWVAIRHVNSNYKYAIHFINGQVQIRRHVGPTMTILASQPFIVPTSPTPVTITISGYTITVSSNGTTLVSATDTSQAIASGTSIVFYASGSNTFVCWDNVVGAP